MATNDSDDEKQQAQDAEAYRQWQAQQAATLPTTGAPGAAAAPAGAVLPAVQQPSRLEQALTQRVETLGRELNPPPAHGWGKVGRVMGTVGQDIGTAIFPNAMLNIPGTTMNRRAELANVEQALGREQERQSTAAERAASAEASRARAGYEQAETFKLQHPSPVLLPPDQWIHDAEGNPLETYRIDTPGGYSHIETYPLGGEPQTYPSAKQTQQMPTTGAPPTTPQPGGGMPQIPMGAPPAVTPPTRPGAIPPGATVGKQDDETRFIARWLKDNKLPNTAENIEKARGAYKSGGPIGDAAAADYMSRIGPMLEDAGLNPAGYAVNGKMTKVEADQREKDARDAQKEARLEAAPDKRQALKDARTMGYATDPSQQTIYTSRADADKKGYPFRELPPGMLEQDAQLLRQLDDVQKNVSRYRKATDSMPHDISYNHALLMQQILENDKIKAGLAAGIIPGADYILDTLKGTSMASAWNTLEKPEVQLLVGYLRARGAVFAYMKALAKSGRSSDRQFQLEEQTIPSPLVGARVADVQMDAWQENLDMASRGLPNNFVGVPHPSQIRREVEQEKAAEEKAAAPAKKGGGGQRWNPVTGKYE